jgi:hypothetical protein
MDIDCTTINKNTTNIKYILLCIILMATVHSIVIKMKVTRSVLVSAIYTENEKEYTHLSLSLFRYLEKKKYEASI